ncbi:hypothetical protein [Microbacterium sp. A93]|uniref:hypothetical protein n=1 Tax=Microbacterium sp. A93 TaxID=3450716 RepID=UPI003F43AB97
MSIPTKFPIRFTCGHIETKDLASTLAGKRKAKAFGLGKNLVCSKCFRSSNREERNRENRQQLIDAQTFDEEHGLPELTGSDKQIAWATRNRDQVLTEIIGSDETDSDRAEADQVVEAVKSLTRAGWWLDNTTDKDLDVEDLIELITTAIDETDAVINENPF